jgi:membrane-bound lytic murein transglycosylase MltF
MEGILLKRLNGLVKIIGVSISILVFTPSIPCVAAEYDSVDGKKGIVSCGRIGTDKANPYPSDTLEGVRAAKREQDHFSSTLNCSRNGKSSSVPHAEFAALVTDEAARAHAPQKTGAIYFAASEFLDTVRNDDMLERFLKKEKAHSQQLDFINIHTFMMYILERLPKFRALFERLAGEYDLDWRLLAAIAYQESHWDPEAVSPTGVRGLMMLTRSTARHVGIKNRTDPEQSVRGGARYFKMVLNKIPKRISEPDRTWLALASYNVGFGHLEDARILTQRAGGNPDSWQQVKQHLPLLSVQKWHSKTKHGYARGHEPVKYVRNIRNYYSILKLLTRSNGWGARADAGGGFPDS